MRSKDTRGATLIEYALLLALISVVSIISLTALGKDMSTKFSTIANSLSSNVTPTTTTTIPSTTTTQPCHGENCDGGDNGHGH